MPIHVQYEFRRVKSTSHPEAGNTAQEEQQKTAIPANQIARLRVF
jgi:hypothetical protein